MNILTNTTTAPDAPVAAFASSSRDVRAAVHSEWIKIRSVRSTAVLVCLVGVIGIAMPLILGRVLVTDPYDDLPFTIGNTLLVSTWLTTLFAVVAGTLLFTSEVQHGTLAGALTARPSKLVLVTAKTLVAAAFGCALGALGLMGAVLGGFASGMDAGDTSGALAGVAWALVLTTLASVLGLGVGLIIRHSAAAVTAVLVWALAIETLVRGLLPATASRLLPFTAAHGLLGTRSAADTPETLAAALSSLGNAAVMGCWAAATIAIGAALLIRRDA